ncbi:hypothetical protein D3C84_1062190 [compost metagenome]
MLGGSPIKVAVPPTFEKITSEIRYGTGLTRRIRVIDSVTGTTSSTVVTLSKKAEPTAVSKDNNSKIRMGCPFAAFAALIATNSNTPDLLVMFTRIIIPIRRVMVSH